jgi:RHS repeat-associated protein
VYDELGRMVKTIFDDGSYTTARYDELGRKVAETRQVEAGPTAGPETLYEYDAVGHLTKVTQPPVKAVSGPEETQRPIYEYEYEYHATGDVERIRDAMDDKFITGGQNRETVIHYDVFGHEDTRTLPGGDDEHTLYDVYDRVEEHTDFKNQKTKYEYYVTGTMKGKLQELQYYNIDLSLAGKIDYEYDNLGRSKRVIEYTNGSISHTTVYGHFDATGQYVSGYDADGHLIEKLTFGAGKNTDTLGTLPDTQIHYEYDQATGRLTRTYTGGSSAPISDELYGYDELGRLKSVSIQRLNGVAPAAVPSTQRYDAVGQVISTTLPTTIYLYDAASNLDQVKLPNGVITDYDYDAQNRLEFETILNSDGSPLQDYDYTLRADGLRDDVIERHYTSATEFSETKIDWTYDDLGRLTQETRDEGNDDIQNGGDYTDAYAFDLVGNRLTKTHTTNGQTDTTHSFYNGRDELLRQEVDLASDGTIDSTTFFAYDANGSTTEEKTVDSQGATVSDKRYVWDAQNHLVGLDANGNGDTTDVGDATFTYDSDGLRVGSQVVGGDTTTDLLDPNNPTGYAQILEERVTHADSSSDLISYLIGQTVLGQAKNAGPVQYLLADGQGSTRMLAHVDPSTGNLVIDQTMNYDAYGSAVGFDASTAQTHVLYTNQVFDPIMQQYVLRARYYNQGIGAFSSFDFGYEGNPSSPQTLHKYLYAGANPVMSIDPTGNMFTLAELQFVTMNLTFRAAMAFPKVLFYYEAFDLALQLAILGIDAIPDHYTNPNYNTKAPISYGEVSTYGDFMDRLDANPQQKGQFRFHHVPQQAEARSVGGEFAGYSQKSPARDEPCIAIRASEHRLINSAQQNGQYDRFSTYPQSMRTGNNLVIRDLSHLRQFTRVTGQQLKNLVGLVRGRYPSLFARLRGRK